MFVGIDIGGTKTHILISSVGEEDRHLVLPTAQWQRSYLLGDTDNAARLVALYTPHLLPEAEVPLAVGAHGCDTEAQCEAFRAQLSLVHPGPVMVVNDAELLGPAADVPGPVISVVTGTGSIVVGTTGEGVRLTTGGHGWLLGDPGSAPALARKAVQLVLRHRDEGHERDVLAKRLLAHCGADDEAELSYLFASDLSITRWGNAAPLVFDCAHQGSPLAMAVITSAVTALAEDISRIRQRGAQGRHIVVAGGVAVNQPLLLEALQQQLAVTCPELTVQLLKIPPVWGALQLARTMTETSTNMKENNGYHQSAI